MLRGYGFRSSTAVSLSSPLLEVRAHPSSNAPYQEERDLATARISPVLSFALLFQVNSESYHSLCLCNFLGGTILLP